MALCLQLPDAASGRASRELRPHYRGSFLGSHTAAGHPDCRRDLDVLYLVCATGRLVMS